MATFPKSEAEVAALAEVVVTGLTRSVETYPAPPVVPAALGRLRDEYLTAKNAAIAAQATAEQATLTKDSKLADLIDGIKSDLRYAENTANYDDETLKLIGWAGRKAPTATQPPGQTRLLLARSQGEGWVQLEWKSPVDGGKPSAYRILRRERPAGPWADAGTAVVPEAMLVDQPRGKEFEYRILAVNKAGEGEASNTVVVVL
jgi:hypothetical protein